MKMLILLIGVVLLFAAVHFHAIAQANVKTRIDKVWFDRLFTGSRASKDNLTEEGLHNRKVSNLCAVGGLLILGVYFVLFSSN